MIQNWKFTKKLLLTNLIIIKSKIQNKKILIISHRLDYSGAPQSLLNIVKQLHNVEGYEFSFLGIVDGPLISAFTKYIDNVHTLKKVYNNKIIDYFLRFTSFFKLVYIKYTIKPDLVFINSAHNLRSMMACNILNIPFIVYLREFEDMLSGYKLILFLRIKLLLLANHIVSVSISNKNWLIDLGYCSTKVSVVYNSISLDYVKRSADENVNKAFECFIKEKKVISIVGYMSDRKGFDYFLEIANKIKSYSEKYVFLIIGDFADNETKNIYDKFISSNSLENRFYVTGFTNNVFKYLKYSSVMCLTSRSESLPRVVLESMSLGVVVIAFDIGGTSELLPIKYKYLVKPYNVDVFAQYVHELAFSKNFDSLSASLILRSESFTHEKMKFKILKIINKL